MATKISKVQERLNAKNKPQDPFIIIGTPMYGGQTFGVYVESLLMLSKLLDSEGIRHAYSFVYNESLITRGRNAIVDQFMQHPDATHLFFIEGDIRFNPHDVLKMLKADKDIICGIYPMKGINWNNVAAAVQAGVHPQELKNHTGLYVVNLVNYDSHAEFNINDPLEIYNGGTGFMMIKRNVFEKLAEVCPAYSNDMINQADPTKQLGNKIVEYFATSIEPETNRLLSEDFHFCRVARLNGFKVYAAPWAKLTHYGSFPFEGNLVSAAR